MLNFTHPQACQALFDHATRNGATMVRGIEEVTLDAPSSQPYIRWTEADGSVHESSPALIIGADGRNSVVRRTAGIELHSAPVRQHITGGLIEAPRELSTHINGHGSSGDLNWYAFPQGPTLLRVYIAHFDVHRYSGAAGTARFLSDLARIPQPDVACLAEGTAVTPVATYPSVDTWTDEPFADGVLLIGDAAGYNDPIIGQGLSLTMADVRDTSQLLLSGARKPSDFIDYGVARSDRFAKLRMASQTMAEMMCNFGAEAAARRLRGLPMMGTDEVVGALAAAMFAGPEVLPPGTALLQAAREKLLAA
jgi:2-polyprenyl-6-methoxyphenol hydroxylase-like FAD-dependent oxidoreductase